MPRKHLARMAAAYEACKELHSIGELNDDLLPVRSLSDEESELEEENAASGVGKKTKAGTKKRKRIYERKVSSRPLWILFDFFFFFFLRDQNFHINQIKSSLIIVPQVLWAITN